MNSRRWLIYMGAVILGVLLGGLLFFWYTSTSLHNGQSNKVNPDPEQALEPLDPLFPRPDKTSYSMALVLDVEHMTLTGTSHITTVNTSGRRLDQLWLAVYPNTFRHQSTTPVPLAAYGGNFAPGYLEFTYASVNGMKAEVGSQSASVQLDLSQSLEKNKTVSIDLEWVLHLPPVAYRLGYQQGVFMLGNFYPYLEMYNRQGWHHLPETKFGDPFCAAAADYTVAITVPGGYQVVSGAELVNRMSDDRGMETWMFSSTKARDFALAAFLPTYRQEIRKVNNVQIQVWGTSGNLAAMADESARILAYFQQIFTPYHRKELSLVEVPMEGFMGMEYDGLIFLSDRAMQPTYSSQQRSNLIAHEIAHQWWYALVGNDQAEEPWLDEGLANWSANLYIRQQADISINAPALSRQMSWPLTAFKNREQYMAAVYNGGEAFWLQVERRTGQEKLLRGLKEYLKLYAGQVASTGDMFSGLMQGGVDSKILHDCWQNR